MRRCRGRTTLNNDGKTRCSLGSLANIRIGLTEHLEGGVDEPSKSIFDRAAALVRLADSLGVDYAWFAEHHAHVHRGHLPTPLLFALHLAGQTSRIALGSGVICLNLHHAIDVAEQVAVADVLSGGRLAPGFGSGSTPVEAALLGAPGLNEDDRHARYAEALQTIRSWWSDHAALNVAAEQRLPRPGGDLIRRSWSAVNSIGAAAIAGRHNLNMLFSHLRTPAQYREYASAYRDAGGLGLIAANRPLLVAETDDAARALVHPALRTLWRRFQSEGKIASDISEPTSTAGLAVHPINFIFGSPEAVACQIAELHQQAEFDVLNVEVTWSGLSAGASRNSLHLLIRDVLPRFQPAATTIRPIIASPKLQNL